MHHPIGRPTVDPTTRETIKVLTILNDKKDSNLFSVGSTTYIQERKTQRIISINVDSWEDNLKSPMRNRKLKMYRQHKIKHNIQITSMRNMTDCIYYDVNNIQNLTELLSGYLSHIPVMRQIQSHHPRNKYRPQKLEDGQGIFYEDAIQKWRIDRDKLNMMTYGIMFSIYEVNRYKFIALRDMFESMEYDE